MSSKKNEEAKNVNTTTATEAAAKPVEEKAHETKATEAKAKVDVHDAVQQAVETGKSVKVEIVSTTESAAKQFCKGLAWGGGVAVAVYGVATIFGAIFGGSSNE